MPGIILVILIIGYTSFVIYRKTMDIKAGKSCCSGCSSCQAMDKCGKSQPKEEDRNKQ